MRPFLEQEWPRRRDVTSGTAETIELGPIERLTRSPKKMEADLKGVDGWLAGMMETWGGFPRDERAGCTWHRRPKKGRAGMAGGGS